MTDETVQSAVRKLAAQAADFAGRADSPTAHPNYQHEKVTRAFKKLALALLMLGVPSDDLHEIVNQAAQTPTDWRPE